jgi:hypothetical protein
MSRLLGALLAGRLPAPVRVPVSASLPASMVLCCPYQSESRYPRRFQHPCFFAARTSPSPGTYQRVLLMVAAQGQRQLTVQAAHLQCIAHCRCRCRARGDTSTRPLRFFVPDTARSMHATAAAPRTSAKCRSDLYWMHRGYPLARPVEASVTGAGAARPVRRVFAASIHPSCAL